MRIPVSAVQVRHQSLRVGTLTVAGTVGNQGSAVLMTSRFWAESWDKSTRIATIERGTPNRLNEGNASMTPVARKTIRLASVGLALLLSFAALVGISPAFAAPASASSVPYYGVAVAPSGDVYVTVPQAHRVERYSATGEQLGAWGSEGSGEGEFVQPKGIAVAGDGTVYVVDGSNARVQYFTGEGEYLGQWGALGEGDGQFFGPEHIAVAPDGNIYVTDYGNYRVQYFTRDGGYVGQWGSKGTGPGEFDLPLGVAVGGDGTVYVTDMYNNRVQYFTPDGQHLGEWETQPSTRSLGNEGPHGVGVGPDGTIYCANFSEGRVERYSISGEFLGNVAQAADSSDLGDPQSVAFAGDGTMHVVDAAEVRVCSATPRSDTTAPSVTVPADIVVVATEASGTVVTFDVSADDAVDGTVSAVADPPSGSHFPVGTTTVVVTAEDSSGNIASRSFTVSVSPMRSEPSSTATSSGEESPSVPPASGSDAATPTAGAGSPWKHALLWGSLLAATAFVTTRRRWLAIVLGIGGLLAFLLLVT
jgi:sugar lactone lactonase YvrE